MTKIGIVGLGLIGGSLGIDLVAKGHEVLGVSRNPQTCKIAKELKAVNDADIGLEILSQAEIIFICTPIDKIIPIVERLAGEIKLNPETIITDVGSVKAKIVEPCSKLWPNFVGGHPMAGTAEQGIEAAQKDLFVNRPYVLTSIKTEGPNKFPTTPQESVARVKEIVVKLGALIYDNCSPEEHDQAVAWISHLPVMVSASLIAACMGEKELDIAKLAQNLASSGFRDTSRVGGGNPELGIMMARYNRNALLRSLDQYRESLEQVINLIKDENWQGLEEFLTTTKEARNDYTR